MVGVKEPGDRLREGDEDLRLDQLFRMLWHRRLIIGAASVIGSLAAIALSFLLTPTYSVQAVLAPVATSGSIVDSMVKSGLGGLASFAGGALTPSDDQSDEAFALLRSKKLTGELIERQGLLPELFHKKWNSKKGTWNVARASDVPTLWDGIERFDDILTISRDRMTGLVTVSVNWRDPEMASNWVVSLVSLVNSSMRDRSIREAERNLAFLNKQLADDLAVDMRQAVFSIIETQMKTLMLAKGREDYSYRIIDPPMTPDLDNPTFPNRPLFLVIGALIGFGVASVWVLYHSTRR